MRIHRTLATPASRRARGSGAAWQSVWGSGLLLALLLLGLASSVAARTLLGTIRAADNGAPLAGATVRLEPTGETATTDAEGTFSLPAPDTGSLRVAAAAEGYRPAWSGLLDAATAGTVELTLAPQPVDPLFRTVVTSYRASTGRTPSTFDNVGHAELRERAYGQDLPLLLEDQPGVYSTSDAGHGMGYTYLKLRGFDPSRIGVEINGVPLNDPSEQSIYWVDLPDFSSSLQDVQIQRGLGFSGKSHFGGTLSLLTQGEATSRRLELTLGQGMFLTDQDWSDPTETGSWHLANRRFSLQFASGLLDHRYVMAGRFSRIRSEGYRERSATDLWGYYLTAGRVAPTWSLTFTTFGGQEETQQAFNGIPQSLLAQSRRLNLNDYYASPDAPTNRYDENLDVFQQPHYQLTLELEPRPTLQLRSTLYLVQGEGYYQNYKAGQSLFDFGRVPLTGTDQETDLIRRKEVDKQQFGWVGQSAVRWRSHRFTLGWVLDRYASDHQGRVLWLAEGPAQPAGPGPYYRYDEQKHSGSGYLDVELQFAWLKLQGEVQLRYSRFSFAHREAGNFSRTNGNLVALTDSHLFFNPKAGVLVDALTLLDGSAVPARSRSRQAEFYFLVGQVSREPASGDYWDGWAGPDDLGARPLFREVAVRDGVLDVSDPRVGPERLLDLELGVRASWQPGRAGLEELRATLALYRMDFRDEIVQSGGVDDDGNPIKGNIDRTMHQGLEATLSYVPLPGLTLAGNLSVSANEARELAEYTQDEGGNPVALDRAGQPLPNFPDLIGNLSLTYARGPVALRVSGQHIGRRYLDFSGETARSIAPYTLLHAQARLDLERLLGLERVQAALTARNLLDTRYETHGWWDAWYGEGEAILFPGACRELQLSLTLGL